MTVAAGCASVPRHQSERSDETRVLIMELEGWLNEFW